MGALTQAVTLRHGYGQGLSRGGAHHVGRDMGEEGLIATHGRAPAGRAREATLARRGYAGVVGRQGYRLRRLDARQQRAYGVDMGEGRRGGRGDAVGAVDLAVTFAADVAGRVVRHIASTDGRCDEGSGDDESA